MPSGSDAAAASGAPRLLVATTTLARAPSTKPLPQTGSGDTWGARGQLHPRCSHLVLSPTRSGDAVSPCPAPQPPRTVQQQHPTAAPCCCQLPVPTWCSPFRRGLPSVAPSAPQQSHHVGGARAEVTFLHTRSTPRCPSHGWVLSVQSWALPSLRGSHSKHPGAQSITHHVRARLLIHLTCFYSLTSLQDGQIQTLSYYFFFLKKQTTISNKRFVDVCAQKTANNSL